MPENVAYTSLHVLMLKELSKQRAEIARQTCEIDTLIAEKKARIAQLQTRRTI